MAANTGLQYGGGLQFSGVGQTVVPQQPIMMNLPSVQESNLQFAGVQQQQQLPISQPINLGYAQQTVPITMPTTTFAQQPILSTSFAQQPIMQQQLPIMQSASWVQQQQQQLPINLGFAQQQQPIMQQQFSGLDQLQMQQPVMQSAVSTVMPAYGGVGALGAAPTAGTSKKTTVAQPIYAQSMVVPKVITQPILRPHAGQSR